MDSLQERLRSGVVGLHNTDPRVDLLVEAADALDAKDAEIARVREEALEEAADCARIMSEDGIRNANRIATAIRALAKGGE